MRQAKTVFRRIASNEVMTPENQCLFQQVIELKDGVVTNLYPLVMEIPKTEWVQGRLILRKGADGFVRAYYKGKILT